MTQQSFKRCPKCNVDNEPDALYCGGCRYQFTRYGVDDTTINRPAPPTPADNFIDTPLPTPYPGLATPKKRNRTRIVFFAALAILLIGAFIVGVNLGRITSTAGLVPTSGNKIVQGNTTPTIGFSTTASTQIPPGTALCQADWSSGMNGWHGTPDWKVQNGHLLNDGTQTQTTSIISAPCDLSKIQNYKLEVKATVLSQGSNPGFDFLVRVTPRNSLAYVVALNTNCQGSGTLTELSIWPWSGWCNVIDKVPFQPSNGTEYTYDIVVKGNSILVYVNGGLMIDATDNSYLSGDTVGLGDYEALVSISSFEVFAI